VGSGEGAERAQDVLERGGTLDFVTNETDVHHAAVNYQCDTAGNITYTFQGDDEGFTGHGSGRIVGRFGDESNGFWQRCSRGRQGQGPGRDCQGGHQDRHARQHHLPEGLIDSKPGLREGGRASSCSKRDRLG